jgi:hypothetical protein
MVSISTGRSWFEPLYKVIYDARFSASREFAREATWLGAHVHEINGDITELWFNDFCPRWKRAPAAVAGLTAPGAIFCLERLAWDHGMRVVFRIEHRHQRACKIEHTVAVPTAMAPRIGELRTSGPDWPARVANFVTQCPARLNTRQAQAAKDTFSTPLPFCEAANDEQGLLVSWLISPIVRADPGPSLASNRGGSTP